MGLIRPILRRSNQTINDALAKSKQLAERGRLEMLELIRAEMREETNRRLERRRMIKEREES